jgi:hypothetical protein
MSTPICCERENCIESRVKVEKQKAKASFHLSVKLMLNGKGKSEEIFHFCLFTFAFYFAA